MFDSPKRRTMSKQRTALGAAIVAATAMGATLAVPGPAQATPPGPGVSGTIISQHTVGATAYILREITIPAGQATGWHFHEGVLYGWVKQGTLSHFDSTCAPDGVYPRGSFIREPNGKDHVHIGINRGEVSVILVWTSGRRCCATPWSVVFRQTAAVPLTPRAGRGRSSLVACAFLRAGDGCDRQLPGKSASTGGA
jgi:hypothetical protein